MENRHRGGSRNAATPGGDRERSVNRVVGLTVPFNEITGRDLSNLDYYFAFAHWKSAAIIHGVYARYREGKKSTGGIDMDGLRLRIERLLATADEALTRHQAKAGD